MNVILAWWCKDILIQENIITKILLQIDKHIFSDREKIRAFLNRGEIVNVISFLYLVTWIYTGR